MRPFLSLCLFAAVSLLPAQEKRPCVFCDIGAGKTAQDRVVYRDDLVVAFMDRAPRNPGHVLVVPVRHADGILDVPAATAARLMLVAQKVAVAVTKTDVRADGFTLQSNTGKAAGQTVSHMHIHVIPRFAGEPPYLGEKNVAPPKDVAAAAKKLRAILSEEPNRSPDRTAPSVTPPAAEELRH